MLWENLLFLHLCASCSMRFQSVASLSTGAAALALAPGLSLRWPAMTFCFFFSCDVPAASSFLLDALYETSVVFSRLLFCSSYAIAFAVRLRIRVFAAPGGHGFFPRRTDAGEESLVQTLPGD